MNQEEQPNPLRKQCGQVRETIRSDLSQNPDEGDINIDLLEMILEGRLKQAVRIDAFTPQ